MTNQSQPYSTDFFKNIQKGALGSAKQVVPLVVNLLHPKSVLDVGCGSGEWLSVFYQDFKISDILGVDGDYMDSSMLAIPPTLFQPRDLTKPLYLNRKFDLVVSLEVAEHIPFEYADTFVENLTRHGDVVLFSAAIPGQGGVHHVNEQFPEYWAALFHVKGFSAVDVLREKLWHNERVEWWYRQNMLLFLKNEKFGQHPDFQERFQQNKAYLLTRIHPILFFRFSYYRRLFRDFNLFGFIYSLVVKECRMRIKQLWSGINKK